MRQFSYILTFAMILGSIVLTAFSPDSLTAFICGAMVFIIILGVVFGLLPTLSIARGFQTGYANIIYASSATADSTWVALTQIDDQFRQKILNHEFEEYRNKIQDQRSREQVMNDIEDYINVDMVSRATWQNLVSQVPDFMTSLGILGTFVGMIVGIRSVGFSSVSAAVTSIQTLLSGIETAFYTSIAGVILSIAFNTIYKASWNIMLRQMALYIDTFHKEVIPSVEEQNRYLERKSIKKIVTLLERIPKDPGYSVAGLNGMQTVTTAKNEKNLMAQVIAAMKNDEFTFYLQPRFNLITRAVTGAEVLVRWEHPTLGLVSPASFIPILESNGYITQLDQSIWRKVCATIRRWIDTDIKVVPLAVNVTKTDLLSMDVVGVLTGLINEFEIPPRWLEIEIAQNAYLQNPDIAMQAETGLRSAGFRVIIDGFDGDFLSLSGACKTRADALKLDLRNFTNSSSIPIESCVAEAAKLNKELIALDVETMERVNLLRKNGCIEGQGYYFSKPLPVDEYEVQYT